MKILALLLMGVAAWGQYYGGWRPERKSDKSVEVALPAFASVSNEFGEPRYPQLRQIMMAAKKTVQVWSAADLGLGADEVGAANRAMPLEALYVPKVVDGRKVAVADGHRKLHAVLAQKLRAAKLV